MKNSALYAISVGYMLLYTVLILASGVWLFLLSQGLGSSAGLLDTLKDIIALPEEKSLRGLIEVATPHLFAMGALIFVVAHFMLFSTTVSKKHALFVTLIVFGLALFDIFSYFAISFGWVVSGWLKLTALFAFVSSFMVLLTLVAFSL